MRKVCSSNDFRSKFLENIREMVVVYIDTVYFYLLSWKYIYPE